MIHETAHVDFSSLEQKVGTVVSMTQELDAAIADERDGRAALLELVLRATRPTLRSLAQRVKVASYSSDASGWNDHEKHHPVKGIWLDGTQGPTRVDPSEQGGTYDGWDTYLLVDGAILDLTYQGNWSLWQNEPCTWEAKVHLIPPENAAKYMVSEGSDEAAIAAIQGALDTWLAGNPLKRAEQAKTHAKKLRAIVELTQ